MHVVKTILLAYKNYYQCKTSFVGLRIYNLISLFILISRHLILTLPFNVYNVCIRIHVYVRVCIYTYIDIIQSFS